MLPTDAKGRVRLLPASIPYRFFAAAAVFHLVGWSLVAAFPGRVLAFPGGFGPPLAALHAFTLGTLTMVVVGASLQVLPVATVRAAGGAGAAGVSWWLLAPGIAVLLAGFAGAYPRVAILGGILVALGLALYGAMLAASLAGAKRQRALTGHGWAALASLVVLILSGLLLVLRSRLDLPWIPGAIVTVHLLAAGFGFIGMFAVGFSNLLLPMFMVARAPAEARQRWVLGVLGASLAATSVAALSDASVVWRIAASLPGFAAALMHAAGALAVVARRRNREPGASVELIRLAWIAFPAAILTGIARWMGWEREGVSQVFVALLVLGWLLSLELGILLRILPFLVSIHLKSRSGSIPPVANLSDRRAARVMVAAHGLAVSLLTAGFAFRSVLLVRIGSGAGLIGAFALIIFLTGVWLRAGAFLRRSAPGTP